MPAIAKTRRQQNREGVDEHQATRGAAVDLSDPQQAPRRFLFSFLLALIIVYPVWFVIHYRGVYDPDIWWHLRTGQWILEHKNIPHVDLFSTLRGKPWVPYSWTFDLVMTLLYRAFGYFGVFVLYPVSMVLAIAAVIVAIVRRLRIGAAASLATIAVVLVAISPVFSPRPGVISVLFFAVQLWLLVTASQTGSSRSLAVLPALYLLWANVHVQFIYGLAALGLFVAAPLAHRLWPQVESAENPALGTRWAVFLGCLIATLINPFGLKIYSTIFGFATQLGQWRYLEELQSPTFRSLNSYVLLLWIFAAWVLVGWNRTLWRWQTGLLLIGCLVAFRQVRDIWFAALSALCALWPGGNSVLQADREQRKTNQLPIHPLSVAMLILIGTLIVGVLHPLSQAGLKADIADEFPMRAAAYLQQHISRGTIYCDLSWGGFLLWTVPEMQVSLDSRTSVHGDLQVERAMAVWSGVRDWSSDPELLAARVVLANPSQPLTSLLRLDPRFRVTYDDGQAVVFEPVGSNQESAVSSQQSVISNQQSVVSSQ